MEANNQQGKAWRTYEEVAAYLLNRFAKELNLPTLGMLYKTATLNALQNVLPSEKHA